MKKLTLSGSGDIHFGALAMDGFQKTEMTEVDKILESLGDRKIWRCNVCNDMHVGISPPKVCPTCSVANAYVEINEKEFMEMMK